LYLVPVLRRVALAGAGGLLLTLVAGPAIAAPAPDAPAAKPDIAVTATFDKASYAANDPVTVTVTVTNKGKGAATEIAAAPDYTTGVTWSDAGFPKFEVAAGAQKTLTRAGVVSAQGAEYGFIRTIIRFFPKGEVNVRDNQATVTAAVPGAKGSFVGRAVRGNNKEVNPALPPVAGVTFNLTSQRTKKLVMSGKTDATGVVTLKDVPADEYRVEFTAPTGWKVTTTTTAYVTSIRKDKQETFTVSLLPTGAPAVTPTAGSPSPSASASPAAPPAPGQTGGGLPVTGASVGVLAGVGALVVAAGAVAFLVARRRRTRFIAGN
jgi:hypothetical protein